MFKGREETQMCCYRTKMNIKDASERTTAIAGTVDYKSISKRVLCRRARCRRGGRCCGRRVLRRPHHHPHHLAGLPQEREKEVRGGGDTQ